VNTSVTIVTSYLCTHKYVHNIYTVYIHEYNVYTIAIHIAISIQKVRGIQIKILQILKKVCVSVSCVSWVMSHTWMSHTSNTIESRLTYLYEIFTHASVIVCLTYLYDTKCVSHTYMMLSQWYVVCLTYLYPYVYIYIYIYIYI